MYIHHGAVKLFIPSLDLALVGTGWIYALVCRLIESICLGASADSHGVKAVAVYFAGIDN
jgi:hypothetical protein